MVVLEEATIGNSTPAEMVPLGVTRAEGTILDDDTAPTGLTISSVSHNQVDEDAGATDITVTVALDGTTQFTVATPVTVEMIDRPGVQNNATLGVDYTATTASVSIPAGESSMTTTITLTPVDDSLSEDDEIARLSAKSTAFAGSAGKGVKIVDNDVEPGEVVLTVAPDTVSESASSVQLSVTGTLAGQSSRVEETVVSLALAGDTATAGDDYQPATATLTIPAGELSATATMTLGVLDDDIVEGNETLEVTGTVPGTISVTPADVEIEDDDQEPTSIALSATTGPIGEGGGAVTIPVQATLLGGGTRSVATEVTLSVADVSATVSDDYTAAWDSSTLTIPTAEYSATANLTLTPVEDTVYEGDEHIAVRGLNSAPGPAGQRSPAHHTGQRPAADHRQAVHGRRYGIGGRPHSLRDHHRDPGRVQYAGIRREFHRQPQGRHPAVPVLYRFPANPPAHRGGPVFGDRQSLDLRDERRRGG